MSFYRSIVLVKQTPNTSTVTENALNADGTINRAALPTVLNPEDLNALEAALEVKDRFGGSVTVISMGPPQAAEILREALYRGADRAILICDRAVAGSDVLATSYILSQAIKKAGEFDFIFCGRQAIDGDTGQTGPECAQRLGVPQVSYMVQIVDVDGKKATLRRATGSGWETVTASLPLRRDQGHAPQAQARSFRGRRPRRARARRPLGRMDLRRYRRGSGALRTQRFSDKGRRRDSDRVEEERIQRV